MGFWIFMLVVSILVPVTMLLFGRMFLKDPPKSVDRIFGYRTQMSMKNEDTWEFAHRCCGKIWWRLGWILLAVSIVIMFLVRGKSDDAVGLVGGILCAAEVAPLLLSIIPVEKALKKEFDEYGFRRRK